MEESEMNTYSVPLEQPCDKIVRAMRFERGDISHFWLTYEAADIISRQCFANAKLRKWYRHTPNVGAHVFLKEGDILKRALVTAHVANGLGIELMDLDRGETSTHHFFENVFYMESEGTRVRALFVSCSFAGYENFNPRCVAEWNTVFEKGMQGRTAIVRFEEAKILQDDLNLIPTYNITLWLPFNGINVNLNEFLRTASPGQFNLAKIFGRESIAKLTALSNRQTNGRAPLEAICENSSNAPSSENDEKNSSDSAGTLNIANVSNISGDERIRVCGCDSWNSDSSDSWHTAHSTECCNTSDDDSLKDNKSPLTGNERTKQRKATKLEGVSDPDLGEESVKRFDKDKHVISKSSNVLGQDGNLEPDYDSDAGSYEDGDNKSDCLDPDSADDHSLTATDDDDFCADNALTIYCHNNASSMICQLFVKTGECFKQKRGVCDRVHVELEPKFYDRIAEELFTYNKNPVIPVIYSEIRVVITFARDPLHFYARQISDESRDDEPSDFSIFQNHINKRDVYSKLKKFGAYPDIGEAVLLEFNSLWYRAVLQEIATASVGIFFFVDYGWRKAAPFLNARRINQEIANFQSSLLKCALYNVEARDISNPWKCDRLNALVNKICVVRVMDVCDDGPMIFIKMETPEGQDIGEQLAESGRQWKLKM